MRSSHSFSLYLRIRSADGGWLYAQSVTPSNGRLQPLHALVDGKYVYCAEGAYYLRYSLNGKRIWQPVGTEASQAQVALQRKALEFKAEALGVAIPAAPTLPAATPETIPLHKTDLTEAIAEYLKDTAAGKSKRPNFAYSYTLKTFTAVCNKKTLEQVDRRDVLNFVAYLRGLGNGPRTISNYVNFLLTFFRHHKVPWPLLKTDKVKYTEKAVSSYSTDEVSRLLAAANQEEADLLQFFLCTGARYLARHFVNKLRAGETVELPNR
jgi:integrase/recombinase XerD